MKIRHSKITASVDTGMSYWYLFKHGLGPGTMPKGVNVLKVIDDGWKDYVLLDKMLTTDELNEYEIKEATPPDDLLAENGYNSLEETYRDVTSSDDMWSDTSSRYYVTPNITEDDLDYAAKGVAERLKYRLEKGIINQITTEDVIEVLSYMSDMWDEYWSYGLRTREQERAFLDDFLNRLARYGVTDVIDNTFASIKCSDTTIEAADNMNIFRFYDWYNTLPLKQRHEVDDWCDVWGYPLYDDCSAEDLSTIHDHFESEFAQRNESNFHVAAFGNDYDELQSSYDFDNPKAAITKWVELQKAWPLNVMITGFQKAEEQLREYVTAHPDWYRALSEKNHCPYDPEYVIAECEKPVRPRTGQYANIYPDQCHPFGLG